MSTPCKIVTLTPAERDEYRTLRDAEKAAVAAFVRFKANFQQRNQPELRRYAPFETCEMTILDEPNKGGVEGTAYAYFTKEIQ